MMENNQVLIKKYISKHRAKSFILQETSDSNILAYRKNGTQDTGPYEDAGPYEDPEPQEDRGSYDDPEPDENPGSQEDP